jgi:hypothetical protein
MMRKSPSASMQKTYDECYLICSTAIYFEGQVSSETDDPRALPSFDRSGHDVLTPSSLPRTTKPKRCAPGGMPSIRSTTTMPTNYRPHGCPDPRPKRPCMTRCAPWSSNARNAWSC